jgi:hypothetical protein
MVGSDGTRRVMRGRSTSLASKEVAVLFGFDGS